MFQLQSQTQQHTLSPPATTSDNENDIPVSHVDVVEVSTSDTRVTDGSSPASPEQIAFQTALLSNLSAPPPHSSPFSSSSSELPATSSYASYFLPIGDSSQGEEGEREGGSLAVPAFRTDVQPQQVASAVNSFRALKVGGKCHFIVISCHVV
jgi:hypothetical protein